MLRRSLAPHSETPQLLLLSSILILRTMRTTLFLFLTFLLSATSCSTCSDAVDSIVDKVKDGIKQDSIDNARRAELEFRIDSLLSNDFTSVNENVGCYEKFRHHTWDTLDLQRDGLILLVCRDGGMILLSTLAGGNAHHHNRLVVKVGSTLLATDSTLCYSLVEPDPQGNISIPDAKGEVLYIFPQDAQLIIDALLKNPKEKVTVEAYYNNELIASYELSEEDLTGIRAAAALAAMFIELGELSAKQSTGFDD